MPNNIILIGFMGSGKTTAGRMLSKKLGRIFIDVDSEIEQAEGKAIPHIFSYGESYFRDLETEMIMKVCKGHGSVIATGGGVVKRAENIAVLRRSGLVFYMKWPLEDLYLHVKGSINRPLLNVPDPEKEMGRMLSEREPLYLSAAHIVLNCAGKQVKTIADEIEAIIHELGCNSRR